MIKNKIISGDCLKAIPKYIEPESVDLIYLDPPFFTQKGYEIIWGNGAELQAYGDRWQGGINVYIEWMRDRILQCFHALKKTGSFYLHCDHHASHYLKTMCDSIFGYDNLRAEIIWNCGSVSGFKSQKDGWIRNHDTIFYYTKSGSFTFNKEYLPLRDEYVKKMFRKFGMTFFLFKQEQELRNILAIQHRNQKHYLKELSKHLLIQVISF